MFATNSCKYCNQIATGQITQLMVANFATRIFAMIDRLWLELKAYFLLSEFEISNFDLS